VLIPDGAGVVFRHELARLTIEETLSPGERSELHAAALRELMTRGDADDRTLAHHAAGCGAAEVVRERAPRAAARSARLGAHREAAELYRLALRFTSPDAPDRAALCTALSYECYLTDQLADALAARDEAMRIADQAGDHLAVGDAQRWLSRLSWFFGRNDDSEKWAASAIETLEPLGESRELAMAYSNMSQLRMLANDWQDAVRWGKRAIALARRLGDREVEIHALNNVGTALCSDSDDVAGLQHLAQSLDMALADDAQEHAARAYTNLGSIAVNTRRFELGARQLRAGIAYCQDHDLDSWRLYMSSWLARSLLEQGRTAAAEAVAADTLRHPRLSPISRIGASVVVALADLRRGGSGEPYLAQALDLAMSTGEVQRLVPVAAARAEAAWLAGRPTADLLGEIDLAWAAALNHPEPWQIGDLCGWLAVFGQPREVAVALPRPFALMLSGNWRAAADEWQRIGSPFWTALALAWSPELDDARTACHLLSEIDAPAVRQAVIRDRHARGLPVPRGPRAASRANSWGLTSREIEILDLLTEGLSNAEIAQQLVLSEKTVGHHVSAILRKLGEPTRSRASAAAIRHGIVTK
jgi:DNA-binding CsgD family transcriptional regulator/tetratricopeptide (TPR) repeat protein